MNCVLAGNSVKAFGKAVHALSRIGDSLWLDPMVKGLALRSVNLAQSAYACFLFSPLFFQQYSLESVTERGSEPIKCKLAMKEEVTLSMNALRVSLRNYSEGRNDHMKMMYTEMSLHPDEFDYFQAGVESDITFCLKELRGLLSFAESHCLPVSVHFSTPGKPVCFSVEDMVLEATVVLATLADFESRSPSQPAETLASTTHSCADAAALPVGICDTQSKNLQVIPDVTELVESSQGSPITYSPALMQLLRQTDDPGELPVPDEACPSAATTPASTTICSLLFRALSSESADDSSTARLPVLACFSDDEDCPRSPLL
ncbi:cell cycle checkpoint control protein RAD9B isoform X5 [Archocentrus centrarchus]|uniref:cell cycle checkpoint control protein RAD9B isoform X5 n=1 Tax=Archocentrus centrarchus TaxID=63155 RepID=UPI0011EA2EFA|nr:cell cycle checkpoint control protein RAD9B isoform X5 [Archocentrus centrarchus]